MVGAISFCVSDNGNNLGITYAKITLAVVCPKLQEVQA